PERPSLVTDVGVRLPAHLTASGLAMLAALPAAQIRALFPTRDALVVREGGRGPRTLVELRRALAETKRAGHATEDGYVTRGRPPGAARRLAPPGVGGGARGVASRGGGGRAGRPRGAGGGAVGAAAGGAARRIGGGVPGGRDPRR